LFSFNNIYDSFSESEVNGNEDEIDNRVPMIDNLNHLNNKQISQPSSYVCNEIDALEHEEEQIDREAASLEKRLRRVMENGIHIYLIFDQFQNLNFCFFDN
jgi:predicted  nucleic acid-binding Zn-ribbon protein